MTVFAGIAEFERDLIRERSAGRQAAGDSLRAPSKTQHRADALAAPAHRGGEISQKDRGHLQRQHLNHLPALIDSRSISETIAMLSRLQAAHARLRHDQERGRRKLTNKTIATRMGEYALFEMR